MSDTPPAGQADHTLIARLGAKARKFKDQLQAATTEKDAAMERIKALEKEMADLRGKADHNSAAKERDEARAKLREYRHKDAFVRAAKEAHVKSDGAIEDLWNLSGYKAEAEEPDPKVIGDLIAEQKKSRDYLFSSSDQSGQPARPNAPGPGAGRGGSDADNQGVFSITRAQANDPLFMRANAAKISQASKEGRFSIADPLAR